MSITLGTTARGKVSLSDQERSWHTQIIGGTGRGKSSLLESMIRQDILAGRGLCLLDPHGTLANDIVAFCASLRIDQGRLRPVHVINVSDPDWSASFNPLRGDGATDPSVRVDAMVAACAQVWGGEDPNRTPLLRKCLSAVFYVLALRGLTLVEATELITSADPHRVRRMLTENLPDAVFDGLWRDFNDLRPSEFAEQFSSTSSRLNLFLKSPVVRRMLGQTSRALDLKALMDSGGILIVNLATTNHLSAENARLIGTLLTSELFLLSLGRSRATAARYPFTMYIDECGDFVTDDVERMLDQSRKFGVSVVLSHQRLSSLKRRSPLIHDAVLGGTHTKIIFGGLMDEDAEVMAREVYRTSFNLERPKHSLDKAVVVDEVPFWLESESSGSSSSTTSTSGDATTWAEAGGNSTSRSDRFYPDIELWYQPVEHTEVTGASSSTSQGGSSHWSGGTTEGTTETRGRSQTLKPVRVVMPTAVHSLEEEVHRAIVKLRMLPKQTAIVRPPNRPPMRVRPLDIEPTVSGAVRAPEFLDRIRKACSFARSAADVEAEMAARLNGLRHREAHSSDDEFFSEES